MDVASVAVNLVISVHGNKCHGWPPSKVGGCEHGSGVDDISVWMLNNRAQKQTTAES